MSKATPAAETRLAATSGDEPVPAPPEEVEVEWVEPEELEETEPRIEVSPLNEPGRSAAAPDPGTPADLSLLPVLTNSQRTELGIPELTINFVGMPTKRQPRPSALINLKKVYVGERIPGTNARLIGVEMHGIAIEANGQQFFVPN